LPVFTTPAGSMRMISAFVGAGAVLHAARHDDALARRHIDDMVAELDAEAALPHQEELFRVVMVVPGEFALDLDDLDLLAVGGGDDFRLPMLGEKAEFFGKADLRRHARTGFLARKSLKPSRGWPAER
jgi:hypothetical protein